MKIASQQKDSPKPITSYFVWLRKNETLPFKVLMKVRSEYHLFSSYVNHLEWFYTPEMFQRFYRESPCSWHLAPLLPCGHLILP